MTRLEGLSPLDEQLGSFPKRAVIDLLEPLLFPPERPPSPEMPEGTPRAYAILDAAKLVNLSETLETSGLPHRCLFKGAAQETWGHVAPWLVALDQENRLTRRLFTQGEGPVGLWDLAPALYFTSTLGLHELWRHFRKFTRIEDEAGKWIYFRFWEAISIRMLYLSRDLPSAAAFFRPCPVLIAPVPREGACLIVSQSLSAPGMSPPPPALMETAP
ncbi:DUF4123 domain-containing protein [Paracoccus aminophilus]|uniref:DUF4123 domain-containing protein n=1 Tax=Paracoccus aminophilus JCM 7686 TaxID=1367847 RepID=S5XJ97_PARAH|nr:DUF4123 domain-containing protein [Paracoccus aminophilus]AGT07259.1 hypothetical protein JCM7686_0148 [Paracoccus aminophilus JCM 7686]